MKKTLIAGFGALLLLTGCSFKPTTPVRDTTFDANLTGVSISDKWWMDFNDSNLNKLVMDVLKNNSDLQLALNNIEILRATLGLSKLSHLPNITYGFDAGRQNNFPTAPNSASNSVYSANLALNYELDVWGKIANTIAANTSRLNAGIYDYEAVKLSLISNAVTAYFQLKFLIEQQAILKETVKSYQNSLSYRQRQYNAGVIDNVAVNQTDVELQRAKVNLVEVTDQISQVNNALLNMSGSDYNDLLYKEMMVTKSEIKVPVVPNGVPSDVLLKRPDVGRALENLRATNYLVGATKADYFPSFSLTGVLGYQSGEFSDLFDSISNSWNIVGSLAGPLIDFGRTSRRVEIANLDQNASFISYDKALKDAFTDVRNALDARKYSMQRETRTADLLKSAQRLYTNASSRYNAGYSEFIDLLDAQRGLLDARLRYSQAKQQTLNSVVNVYKAFGGGFEIKLDEQKELIDSNVTIQPNMSKSPFSK
ncbi:MAG: TolC family protein [Campylobacter sp.]|nr:TolC family protein [Campylobacter sp.]